MKPDAATAAWCSKTLASAPFSVHRCSPPAALMNNIDSPRAVTPPATIMSDEEEELREFCDGFDEGTTDRIVEAFGSLSELKAVYELDRYVTDETLTQAGVRACWKNLLFKRLGGAPEYRMTAYNAPSTPVPPPPPTKTMTPRAKKAQAKSTGLGFLGVLALIGAVVAGAVALLPRDVVMGAMDVVMPAAQKALDVLAEGGQAVVAKATAMIH